MQTFLCFKAQIVKTIDVHQKKKREIFLGAE